MNGNDGSEIKNEANATAAVLLRQYSQKIPNHGYWTMNIRTKTAEEIFDDLKNKFEKRGNTTLILVDAERGRNKIDWEEYKKSKTKKTIWILVETYEIRTDLRDKFLKELGLTERNLKNTTGSSVAQIEIKGYKTYKNTESIRIMFKPPVAVDRKNYKWYNHTLEKVCEKLNSPGSNNVDEFEVLKKVNKEIAKYDVVTLKIGQKSYNNVVGLNGGEYGAKADFVIIDVLGREIGFISYKKGSAPQHFQQYSGISKSRTGPRIHNHKEVEKFREQIVTTNIKDQILTEKKTVYIRIKDSKLKKMAIFGKEHGRKRGQDNVDFFAQGRPLISTQKRPNGKIIVNLNFSSKLVKNGNLSGLNKDYDPVLGARKDSSNRIVEFEGKTSVPGVRAGMWPEGYMTPRNAIDISNF